MTPEQQRIAIAETCGWYRDKSWEVNHLWNHPNVLISAKADELPDYLSDLNAMAEAENFLTGDQWQYYFDLLVERIAVSSANPSHATYPFVVHASAPARAEAFLRTIGKWID